MVNPEIQYWLWRSEQLRRDIKLERRRAFLQAQEPDPLSDPAIDVSERSEASDCCELGVAS